jgi:hypothetical protein
MGPADRRSDEFSPDVVSENLLARFERQDPSDERRPGCERSARGAITSHRYWTSPEPWMARSRVCACRGCETHAGSCGWPTMRPGMSRLAPGATPGATRRVGGRPPGATRPRRRAAASSARRALCELQHAEGAESATAVSPRALTNPAADGPTHSRRRHRSGGSCRGRPRSPDLADHMRRVSAGTEDQHRPEAVQEGDTEHVEARR